ncbi:MAG: C2 domain-containing protein, partial [archaeon]|nr:C2 domain-containing protein [archaeon]
MSWFGGSSNKASRKPKLPSDEGPQVDLNEIARMLAAPPGGHGADDISLTEADLEDEELLAELHAVTGVSHSHPSPSAPAPSTARAPVLSMPSNTQIHYLPSPSSDSLHSSHLASPPPPSPPPPSSQAERLRLAQQQADTLKASALALKAAGDVQGARAEYQRFKDLSLIVAELTTKININSNPSLPPIPAASLPSPSPPFKPSPPPKPSSLSSTAAAAAASPAPATKPFNLDDITRMLQAPLPGDDLSAEQVDDDDPEIQAQLAQFAGQSTCSEHQPNQPPQQSSLSEIEIEIGRLKSQADQAKRQALQAKNAGDLSQAKQRLDEFKELSARVQMLTQQLQDLPPASVPTSIPAPFDPMTSSSEDQAGARGQDEEEGAILSLGPSDFEADVLQEAEATVRAAVLSPPSAQELADAATKFHEAATKAHDRGENVRSRQLFVHSATLCLCADLVNRGTWFDLDILPSRSDLVHPSPGSPSSPRHQISAPQPSSHPQGHSRLSFSPDNSFLSSPLPKSPPGSFGTLPALSSSPSRSDPAYLRTKLSPPPEDLAAAGPTMTLAASTTSIAEKSPRVQAFDSLAERIQQQIVEVRRKAIQFRDMGDKQNAVFFLSQEKALRAELDNLQKAKASGAPLPGFRVEEKTITQEITFPDISPMHLQVTVVSASGLATSEHPIPDACVHLSLPFPTKEAPQTAKSDTIRGTPNPKWEPPFACLLQIQRKKG